MYETTVISFIEKEYCMMTEKEQRQAAKAFSEYWKGKGDEKGESQKFWLSLLLDVFGVEHPESYISFEDRVF
jgi:hypothetical protein